MLWLAFTIFVLASGSRWLLATYFPSDLPPLAEQSLHELTIGLCAGLAAWRHKKSRLRPIRCIQIGLYGILLLGLPSILATLSHRTVPGLTGLALMTLAPAAVLFLSAQRAPGDGARSLLLPALAAAGGAMWLIPMGLPSSWEGRFWLLLLGLCCLPVAFASVRLHEALKGVKILPAMALLFGSSGMATALFSLPELAGLSTLPAMLREFAFCAIIDAPLAWLSVRLLREMQPVRFSTRYLLIPLVSILQSMVFVRPGIAATAVAGGVLMLAGAGFLLANAGRETTTELNLR